MTTIRLYNLTLSLDDDPERALLREAAKRTGLKAAELENVRLVKRGVDARGRTPHYNCTADLEVGGQIDVNALIRKLGTHGAIPKSTPPLEVKPGSEPTRGRVVVIGSGPAGGFAAYVLALNGFAPLLLERGRPAPERLKRIGRFNARAVELDPEDNALFGEGGAGSFSDGKLHTSNRRDPFIPRILEAMVEFGAPERILVDASPHVGTDILFRVVVKMRERIESLGGEVRFSAKMTDLEIRNGRLSAIVVNESERIETSTLILAPGHSARDTYSMLL